MSPVSNEQIISVNKGLVEIGVNDDVKLLGSKCGDCAEVSLGTNAVCTNCGSDSIEVIQLSSFGKLWTYTIIRHKPPGDYLGEEPFKPFGLGLVELPDGLRIMAPLVGDVDAFRIGDQMEIEPWILSAAGGRQYNAFRFSKVSN